MKIEVDRNLIEKMHRTVSEYHSLGTTYSYDVLRDVERNLENILKDNPLPEKWAVVRIDDIVIKGVDSTPKVSTEIMVRFNSQKEAEEWVIKAKFSYYYPHSNYYNVKVEYENNN